MLDHDFEVDDGLRAAMLRALQLATRGEGLVEPNPMVGCVLVRDGQIVAEGWHERFGGPHAEVAALADARQRGVDPSACTLVVTLEPCSHHGKTPPCAEAVLAAGVKRVVVAMVDPFPQVAGRGIAQLREAGVAVAVGVEEESARRLSAPFVKRVTTGRPWVIAKWAQTLDGRIATRTGDSRWISGEASRRRVHELRARVDAVIVGMGTVLADDPSLTARDVAVRRIAKRVVIGRRDLPARCKLATDGGPDVMHFADPVSALDALGAAGATNVLVEGGAALMGSMLDADLIDEAWVFLAPKLLGDANALPALRGLSVERIADAKRLALRQVERLGDDLLVRYDTEQA